MRYSITRKITGILIGLLAGTILLCWFINSTFLEKYYIMNKQSVLLETFEQINSYHKKNELSTKEAQNKLTSMFDENNLMMMILDSDGTTFMEYTSDPKLMYNQFQGLLLGVDNIKWVKSTKQYDIGQAGDPTAGTEYLVLMGTLMDGKFILLRSPVASIKESVWVSNRFLSYVGFFGILVSALISFFVTRKITNPILILVDISKRMKNLDFDAKYVRRGNSEIDLLGEHMNQMSEELERTISELKSANNVLKIDNEHKTRLDHMRKEFVSNVSHELKTPLALIQGYAEGLKECINDDEESRDFYCEVIIDEADKMNQMVKKILTLNQLESGQESIVIERFDVSELIQGVIQATAILRDQNQISIEYEESGPVYVWADEFKTEEILVNYMSNAIHHADNEKKIIIKLKKESEVVRISVFNTGKPIPDEDLEHIWTKFYKVDKARTREYGGSGVGLSIVKAIAESFHRECGVINHEDGVEFWFELDCQNRA